MLTRAYDAIMASLQVPMILQQNVDFNNSAIDDSVLNCRDFNGSIRCVFSGYFNGSFANISLNNSYLPFASWNVTNSDFNTLLPDEEESAPDYEDYSVVNGTPSGWNASSQNPSFSKSYDSNTKEIVCSVTVLWQNTSGAAKTVYGVSVRNRFYYRNNNSMSPSGSYMTYFLTCREHFASPVVVEDQGIISLTFTWRVGRAGLVSATAAAAE